MSSSKVLPGCLVSLVAVVVFYFSWVALPSVRAEEEVKKLLARQQQAFEEDQQRARDASLNGFIDPQLSPYWGRKSVEWKPQSKAEEVTTALREFGFLSKNEQAELALSRRQGEAAFKKAVANFEAFHPVLRAALHRPYFIIPSSESPGFESENANFLAQRSIAQALSAYAEVQLARGKPSAALDAGLEILKLARLVVGQKAHPLITVMIASALQTTAQETLSYVLQSSAHWTVQDLNKALTALQSSPVSRELGLECMEYELWVAQNSFLKSPDLGVWKGPLLRAPGVWRREWRLFQNDYYPLVEAARTKKPLNTAWLNQSGMPAWLLGQHSLTSQTLLPNFERVMNLLEVSQQRHQFLHLYVELLLKKEQGRLPKELSPQWLGRLDPKRLAYQVEKGEPHLEYDLEPGLAQSLPPAGPQRDGAARWENLMRPHWSIPVAP
jgi:hypothetical protein